MDIDLSKALDDSESGYTAFRVDARDQLLAPESAKVLALDGWEFDSVP